MTDDAASSSSLRSVANTRILLCWCLLRIEEGHAATQFWCQPCPSPTPHVGEQVRGQVGVVAGRSGPATAASSQAACRDPDAGLAERHCRLDEQAGTGRHRAGPARRKEETAGGFDSIGPVTFRAVTFRAAAFRAAVFRAAARARRREKKALPRVRMVTGQQRGVARYCRMVTGRGRCAARCRRVHAAGRVRGRVGTVRRSKVRFRGCAAERFGGRSGPGASGHGPGSAVTTAASGGGVRARARVPCARPPAGGRSGRQSPHPFASGRSGADCRTNAATGCRRSGAADAAPQAASYRPDRGLVVAGRGCVDPARIGLGGLAHL